MKHLTVLVLSPVSSPLVGVSPSRLVIGLLNRSIMTSVQSGSVYGGGEDEFNPVRVLVLSELSSKEKEKYYKLLLTTNSKFHIDGEGRYIANVRLLAPGVKKPDASNKRKEGSVSACRSLPWSTVTNTVD
jgi:hypothetical protein